jgi:O-antigen ligase
LETAVDKALRTVVAGLPVILVLALIVLAQWMPGYFTNQQYLGGLIVLQVLAICLWRYDRLFFPFLMGAFFWAGMALPMSKSWTLGRWVVLGAGALIGLVRGARLGPQRYHPFHLVAMFCVATALISAMVSPLPQFSLMKAFSLMLLFLYGSSGVRLVLRDPDRFFRGLLLACEISVYASALSYLVLGHALWGSPNSLGAVEGVVAVPLLLWGALVAPTRNLRLRRAAACLGALYLVYFSVSRAAMLAAIVATLALLIGLRRQKLMVQGLIGVTCLVAITIIVAPQHFEELNDAVMTGVVYKGHREEGLLGSRMTPWQATIQVIKEHPYLGSGFGTSLSGDKPFGEISKFASTSLTNREHGSSYLAITEWVGLLGILPFVLLISLVIRAIVRVYLWMRRTGSAFHYSVPLMMVMIAGLTHAFFEDWLFAAGYYLTVLFWSFAFLLMDLIPESVPSQTAVVHGMRFRYTPSPVAVRQ